MKTAGWVTLGVLAYLFFNKEECACESGGFQFGAGAAGAAGPAGAAGQNSSGGTGPVSGARCQGGSATQSSSRAPSWVATVGANQGQGTVAYSQVQIDNIRFAFNDPSWFPADFAGYRQPDQAALDYARTYRGVTL